MAIVMAREANITQEQVNAAADALRAAGTKPTVRAVRERLVTGSNAVVMRLLDVWKSAQVKVAYVPVTLPGPLRALRRNQHPLTAQRVIAAVWELWRSVGLRLWHSISLLACGRIWLPARPRSTISAALAPRGGPNRHDAPIQPAAHFEPLQRLGASSVAAAGGILP